MYFSEIKELILKNLQKHSDKKIVLNTCLNENFGDLAVFLPNSDFDIKELNFDFIEKKEKNNNYLNIYLKKPILFQSVISEILNKKKIKQKDKVLLEYLSPNTNKPLHLGHLRNGTIGLALAKSLEVTGNKVIKLNMINDRGEHICKSMLAYQKWGQGQTPEKMGMKGDYFVGYWYVYYSQRETPELKEQVHEMLQKWEKGDKEVLNLWKKMNKWFYQGFEKTCQKLNLEFDKKYYESKTYKLGKSIVKDGLKKGVFYQGEKGEILFDLPEKEFGLEKDGSKKKVTVLREDKTSVYLTQDLGLAFLKYSDFKFDKSIYVVGLEQTFYFKYLFYILKALGYKWADHCIHFSYNMVYLPEGKMKSREGKVVEVDDLIDQVQKLVQNNYSVKDEEKSLKIALAAIKFNLLLVQPKQDIRFDPEKSISLEGKTGPYCQYALVRAFSILEKEKLKRNPNFSILTHEKEIIFIRQLSMFSEIVQRAADNYNPSLIANYVYDLAQTFNRFYDALSVLKAENQEIIQARLYLVKAFSETMKKGLTILNIPYLEKM